MNLIQTNCPYCGAAIRVDTDNPPRCMKTTCPYKSRFDSSHAICPSCGKAMCNCNPVWLQEQNYRHAEEMDYKFSPSDFAAMGTPLTTVPMPKKVLEAAPEDIKEMFRITTGAILKKNLLLSLLAYLGIIISIIIGIVNDLKTFGAVSNNILIFIFCGLFVTDVFLVKPTAVFEGMICVDGSLGGITVLWIINKIVGFPLIYLLILINGICGKRFAPANPRVAVLKNCGYDDLYKQMNDADMWSSFGSFGRSVNAALAEWVDNKNIKEREEATREGKEALRRLDNAAMSNNDAERHYAQAARGELLDAAAKKDIDLRG